MPQMAQSRFLTFVLIADARIRAADGDYRGALERCLMTGTFARHIGDDTLISYLVSIAVRGLEYRCMQDIMGQAASDAKLLQWLKNELATAGDVIVSIDGRATRGFEGIRRVLRDKDPGTEVNLVIRRGKQTIRKKLRLMPPGQYSRSNRK